MEKRNAHILILIISVVFLLSACNKSNNNQDSVKRLERYLDIQIKEHKLNGSILLGNSDTVFIEKYEGFANIDTKEKIDNKSSFYIASVSKTITALCVTRLEEENKLSYQDTIVKYFPDIEYRNVTIDNLLHHTSGLPSLIDIINSTNNEELKKYLDKLHYDNSLMNNNDVLHFLRILKIPSKFVPGEKFEYNNLNYILLASIVEKVSKMSYPDFINKVIVGPLGLRNTYVYYDKMKQPEGTQRVYGFKNNEFCDLTYLNGIYGAGNIYSSCDDLYSIENAIFNGKLISKNNLTIMTTPLKLSSGKLFISDDKENSYGYGIIIKRLAKNKNIYWHDGVYNGFTSYVGRNKNGFILVILMNIDNTENTRIKKEVITMFDNM